MSTTTRNDTSPDDTTPKGTARRRRSDRSRKADRGSKADRRAGEATTAGADDRDGPGGSDRVDEKVIIRSRSAADQAREQVAGGRSIDAAPEGRGRAERRRATGTKADRIGGVAPWVPPRGRLGRRLRMREWARRGFVPLSPGRQKLRHRILPRTVIGIAFMLMATGIGAAFSGAAFYAYYDDRLAENERTVARFVEGFDQQFTDAAGALDEMRVEAVGTIRDELDPLGEFVDDATGVVGLPATAGPSVWFVETRDENGAAVVGSAFAVVGHRGGTALVTSHSVVEAATREPGPPVELVKDDQRILAEVWSWDEANDVALLVVDEEIPTLPLAGDQAQVESVGRRVFVLGGFGGQGASAAPGVVIDQSALGLQHTAPVGTLFAGGPLLDGEGRVLGMASLAYRPLGVEPGAVAQAPDVAALCAAVLRCAEVDETVSPEVADG